MVNYSDLFPKVKNNLSATRDPSSGDGVYTGYSIGSRWINTSSGAVFTCVNANGGQWEKLSGSGAGGGADEGFVFFMS